MANNIIVSDFQKKYPSVPAELAGQLATVFTSEFDGQFRRLSLKGMQFSIRDGGATEVLPDQILNVVIVSEAQYDHHTYYASTYDPNAEDIKPTAVWMRGETPPSVVPTAALQKDAAGRNLFSTQHRIVLVRILPNGSLDMLPIAYDVGALSLYSKNVTVDGQTAYSYAAYHRFLTSHRILPCQLVTRIIFNRDAGVPNVRFVPVMKDSVVVPLDANTQKLMYELAISPEVKALATVNRLPAPDELDTPTFAAAPAQPAPAPAQSAPAPAQPAPAPAQPAPAPQPQPQAVAQPQVIQSTASVPPAPQPTPAPQAQPADPSPAQTLASVQAQTENLQSSLDAMLNSMQAFS